MSDWNRARRGRKKILLGVLLLLSGAFYGAAQPEARNGEAREDCQSCHPEVYNDIANKPFVHRPELEQKCGVCHLDAAEARAPDKTVVAGKSLQGMQWVAKNLGKSREHWLKLGQDLAGQSVLVRVEGEDGRVRQVTEKVPELSRLAEAGGEQATMTIEQPEVISVQRGVLLSATVAWKTGKVSDSVVYYGETGPGNATPVDGRLTRQHEVVITGLAPARTYRFVAASTDTAGNTVRSQEMTFSTARPFARESADTAAKKAASQPLGMEKAFYRGRGHVLLHVAATEPVSVMVGSAEPSEERGTAVRREARPGSRLPARHPSMVDRYTLTVTVCLNCHPATKGVVSHPVNVYPKNGMVIPGDYPTLPDGRVSCMSCHVAHAGHYQYRLPKPTKKALCVGCHKNFR